MEVELTQGKVAIIDDDDWDLVSGFKWYADKGGNTYYATTMISLAGGGRTKLKMHRLILGITDPNIHTDHRDGDGLNNRRENLRSCSHALNMRNRQKYKNNSSGYKGVSWYKQTGKWVAKIRLNGKLKHLGYHATPEAAHSAYCAAAIEMHGEFANSGQQAMEQS